MSIVILAEKPSQGMDYAKGFKKMSSIFELLVKQATNWRRS